MERETHERALGAAIRVALGVTALAGCDHTEPAPQMAEAPTTTAPAGTGTASPGSDPAAPKKKPADDGCKAKLKAAYGVDDPNWYNTDKRSTDPELVKCCTQLANGSDGGAVANIGVVRGSGCCHVEFDGVWMACTPWGPPVPPAMNLALLRALLRGVA